MAAKLKFGARRTNVRVPGGANQQAGAYSKGTMPFTRKHTTSGIAGLLIAVFLTLQQFGPEVQGAPRDATHSARHEKTQQADRHSEVLIESAFSPGGGALNLVLRVIESAEETIRLQAYSFTSPEVVRALREAKARGVEVRVVVDRKGNTGKASVAALNLLVNAGIPTRTVSAYAIHHDRVIIVDGKTIQTGSFNYSKAAGSRNSENVLVVWNAPENTAKPYLEHWQSRWDKGTPYQSSLGTGPKGHLP